MLERVLSGHGTIRSLAGSDGAVVLGKGTSVLLNVMRQVVRPATADVDPPLVRRQVRPVAAVGLASLRRLARLTSAPLLPAKPLAAMTLTALTMASAALCTSCATRAGLRDFTSDGCSLFPDGNLKDRT